MATEAVDSTSTSLRAKGGSGKLIDALWTRATETGAIPTAREEPGE